ncbi:hypothetical protein AAZX31_05G147700 [Glycine max]|uniref:Peptidase C1A papain C-terminal domain-containing protein n=1 Tax=Glycine max TaxID=3847 RepID=A0A0R0K177_SOYBN
MGFLVLLLFSLLGLSSSSSISHRSILDLDLAKFTTQKQAKRPEIFKNNLNCIRDMNANRKSPHSHRLGLNKFADITPQEFSKKYLQAPKDVPRHINMADKELKEEQHSCDHPPASWDWREKGVITDVKHQGLCELVDCVESEGCSSGWPDDSFVWVLEHGGIATDADYPYRAKECRYKANKIQDKVTIDGYDIIRMPYESTESEREKAFLCAILEQPISGIYGGGNCSKYWVNHFVLLVGYGSADGVDYWIAKNSWGEDWGKDGYIWIQRNTGNFSGVCGMNYFPVYPTKKKSETLVSAGIKAHRRVDHSPL